MFYTVTLPATLWFFDKAKRVSPTVTACGNVVAKATKNPDAVWAFYEYFMAEEPAQNRAKAGWGMPARKSWFERLPHEQPHEKRAFTTLQQEIKLMPTLNFNPYLGEDTVNQVGQDRVGGRPELVGGEHALEAGHRVGG
jgi:multiple sugar transport system substrate-binding protein